MAPLGIARQVLRKANTIVELALVFLACAALTSLRLNMHFCYLVFPSLHRLRAIIVLALRTHALTMTLYTWLQAHAVLLFASASACTMDLLDSYSRQLNRSAFRSHCILRLLLLRSLNYRFYDHFLSYFIWDFSDYWSNFCWLRSASTCTFNIIKVAPLPFCS